MVNEAGGRGIPVRVDHSVEREVAALFERVKQEQGRVDVLVNVFWGGGETSFGREFWKLPLEEGRAMWDAVWPHVVTSRYAAPLMVERGSGLVVQITENDSIGFRGSLYYDLARTAEVRLAYALAEELGPHGVVALAVTPGFMRTEQVLDTFGATEESWR